MRECRAATEAPDVAGGLRRGRLARVGQRLAGRGRRRASAWRREIRCVIVEAMKMEVAVVAEPAADRASRCAARAGRGARAGDTVAGAAARMIA